MAKPDMSRNKDLAGKTVSKGGYNISYNENGYATSAIKTGSKTGKAAAPSADTVGGGGSDRGSYGGSVYDQEHFSNDELRSAAEVRAAAAAGKTTWADAHDYVERIRSNYGYSGDSDGSRYIPLEMGGGGRGNGGGGFSYEAAPTYTSRYQNQIDDLTRQILNREAFSYDPEKDPTYQQYKESYTRSGERAMQDTLGQVSARTGGLASSYAGSAAQQTYDNYMGALADKIPELKQLAYSMYQDEGNTQRANLEMLVALEQGDYAKYADLLAQYNTDRSFDYGVHRDNISDERYNNEWNYSVGRDQIADKRYEDETAYNRETYKDETEYNRALAKAQTLAAGGDFSGYKALGYTDQEIAGLKSAYNKAQASARSGGSKSGGSSASEDVYAGMYKAGIRSEGDAYAWLLSAGYNTTQAGKLAGYYADWMKNQGGKGSGSGGKTSLDWDQDEGIFTWNGRNYSSVEQLLNEISQAGLTDSELATLKRKFKLFGFDLS
jgi:hypothetical protein